jgi:hypothetical protein
MFIRNAHALIVILVAGLSAGCLAPKRGEYVSTRPVAVADPSYEADRLWEAIQDTLREHRFRLDRVDRREGVITTMPVGSQHLLEFWRHDVNTREDLWESTLNPIRRWVSVSVTRGPDNAWQELACVVHRQRFSSPDRQFNSSGAAYQYFGDSLPSTTGLARVTSEQDQWLDQGRDPAMEEYLLSQVFARVDAADADHVSRGGS